MPSTVRALSALVALLSVACEPEANADGGIPPDSAPARCEGELAPFETGDPNGHADPLGATAGQARAGRLEASMLPVDRTDLAVWDAGDFVLANDRVALLIEDAGPSDLYDPYGGRPVGIAAVSSGALVDAGDFNEILFGFGAFLVATERVTVLNDGSDGAAAVVRATGPLGELEFAGDLIDTLAGGDDHSGLPAAMDYALEPGTDAITVTLHVGQPAPRNARVPFILQGFFQHYRMTAWTAERGFGAPRSTVPMVGFIDDVGMSYAWLAPEGGALDPLLEQSGVLVFSTARASVPACSQQSIPLGTLLLGGPGLPGLQRALARRRGEPLRTVTGVVTHADGSPAPGARVHVRGADARHFARLLPEPDGTFSVDVPEGEVSFFAHRLGTPLFGPVAVSGSTSTVDLILPAVGTIHVVVTDITSGEPIPARVQVMPVGGAPEVLGDLGERSLASGRAHVEFTTTGALDLPVAPGEHDVVISRGYEFELETERVTVAAGETVNVAAALEHVVDTTGVMCADYHIHTHRSPDSPDSPQYKLLSLIADGVEIAIRSDHEWVNDFQPVIETLGVERYAFGIGGQELTTFAWGHFGVFPLVEDRSMTSGGAISWVGRLPPAVFADVRSRIESPALIINHPRSGGVLGGYFNAAGLDRLTGAGNVVDHWDEEFTLVEVFNDSSFEQNRTGTVADWFALLEGGRRVFAIGASDSHNLLGSPVGYPRTCLALGTDDTADLTANMVRDVTAAGHSTISGGIYLDVVGPGGAGPGDDVMGAGAIAMFDVTVQAASWIDGITALEVIVDGVTTETIPIREADRDLMNPAIRLRGAVSVPVDINGSWVVFHVASDTEIALVHPGRTPFAVSNPVFLAR